MAGKKDLLKSSKFYLILVECLLDNIFFFYLIQIFCFIIIENVFFTELS